MLLPGRAAVTTTPAAVALTLALVLSACTSGATPAAPRSAAATGAPAGVTLPDPSAGFDYQLGGAYEPPDGVSTVERDRTAQPARLGYDICYVNGFQTQPAESETFARENPDLVLRDGGEPLVDPGWPDEFLFDTSTAGKRAELLQVVGPWIAGCAEAGYRAVEIDNLDSYTRSQDALTLQDNLEMAATYAREAHRVGLAIAQKNTADQARELADLGYDFAVTESCHRFQECDAYTSVYSVVLDIEYTDELGEEGFAAACSDPERPAAMILRDHDLVTPDDDQYVFRRCS